MAREYTAFISYRHCPLDIAVAETLHKHIERFRVPKDLRKDGKTGLGVVFRDRDELPLSNNLTHDIYEALDHAKFLIVVCTPETPKSIWVEREIEYFIEKHGRERILTVLADGTPEESIPKIITNIYAPDGKTVVDRVEPLCAFLVDGDEKKVLKNLKKEFLRLVAAILGCHYDALVQRQKRYRAQMITYAIGVLAVIALLFVGMLVNRNREIEQKSQEIAQKNQEIEERKQELEEQLRQTQINESQALTLLSQQQLADGDRLGAIKSALNALPHDGDGRPYSAAAEGALADALNIYNFSKLDYYLTIEQPTDIVDLTLSEDGRYLVTIDAIGCLRCFNTRSSAMLWECHLEEGREIIKTGGEILEIIEHQNTVLYSNQNTYTLSLKTGEILNSIPSFTERADSGADAANIIVLSPDETAFVRLSKTYGRNIGLNEKGDYEKVYYLEAYRTDTFEQVYGHTLNWDESWEACNLACSLDGSRLAVLFSASNMELVVLDTTTLDKVYQQTIIPREEEPVRGSRAHLAWLPNNELMLYYEQRMNKPMDTATMRTYFVKFSENGEYEEVGPYNTYRDTYIDYDAKSSEILHYLTDTHIYFQMSSKAHVGYVLALELDTLQCTADAPCYPVASYLRKDGSLMVVTGSGEIGYITNSNYSLWNYDIYQYGRNTTIATGTSGEKEILCLVPESIPNTVVVISEPNRKAVSVLESPAIEEYGSLDNSLSSMDCVVFPSGKAFLTIDRIVARPHEKRIAVTIYDAPTSRITDSFVVESEDLIYFSGFSADEIKLLFRGFIYDMLTHTRLEYENGIEIYGDYRNLIDSSALNNQLPGMPMLAAYKKSNILYWWTDGANLRSSSIPYDMKTYATGSDYTAFTHLGGNGLFVQPLFENSDCKRTNAYGVFSAETEEWHLLENTVNSAGFPRFSVGNTERVVAFADFDRVLRVYDFDKDAIIHEWPLTVSPSTVKKLQYIANDQYLLIFTESDSIHLIDMCSGTELGSYYLELDSDADSVSVYEHDGVAYLFGMDETLRIDLPTGVVLATIPYMKCYLPNTNRAICVYGDQLVAIPIYSWEELAQKGWELIHAVEENSIT